MTFSEYRSESLEKLWDILLKQDGISQRVICCNENFSTHTIDNICANSWSGKADRWDGIQDTTDYCAVLLKAYIRDLLKDS